MTENIAANFWSSAPPFDRPAESNVHCDDFSQDECPAPADCEKYAEEGLRPLFWALVSINNFHYQMRQLYNAFQTNETDLSLLIKPIASDFHDIIPTGPASTSDILGKIGGFISFIAGFSPLAGARRRDTSSEESSGVTGALGSTIGAAMSLVGSVLPSRSNPLDPSHPEAVLSERTLAVFQKVQSGLMELVTGALDTGDVSAFPKEMSSGDYDNGLVNFFDKGRWLINRDAVKETVLRDNINTFFKRLMVGIVMQAAGYWVLQDASPLGKCSDHSFGLAIDGHCYTLESISTGYEDTTSGNRLGFHQQFSKGASDDIIEKMKGYNVTVEDVIRSSVDCQAGNDYYGGTVDIDYEALYNGEASSKVPKCFYSLPVFYVQYEVPGAATTPCGAYTNNATADKPQAGKTYLPDYLNTKMGFDTDYCCAEGPHGILCSYRNKNA